MKPPPHAVMILVAGLPAADALIKCAQAFGTAETFPKVFATAIKRLHEFPDQRAECVAIASLSEYRELGVLHVPSTHGGRRTLKR